MPAPVSTASDRAGTRSPAPAAVGTTAPRPTNQAAATPCTTRAGRERRHRRRRQHRLRAVRSRVRERHGIRADNPAAVPGGRPIGDLRQSLAARVCALASGGGSGALARAPGPRELHRALPALRAPDHDAHHDFRRWQRRQRHRLRRVGGSRRRRPRGYIDGQVRQWGNDLVDFVSRVRTRAPNARIVAYNLPNLGAAPYLAGRTVLERSIMQRIATGLSDQVNVLTTRSVIVVDLMCDPRAIQPSTFSADGFHPSDAGYALMADLGMPPSAAARRPRRNRFAPPVPSCPCSKAVPARAALVICQILGEPEIMPLCTISKRRTLQFSSVMSGYSAAHIANCYLFRAYFALPTTKHPARWRHRPVGGALHSAGAGTRGS